jgi:hypothetical protein
MMATGPAGASPGTSCRGVAFVRERRQPRADRGMIPERTGKLAVMFRFGSLQRKKKFWFSRPAAIGENPPIVRHQLLKVSSSQLTEVWMWPRLKERRRADPGRQAFLSRRQRR